MVKSRYLDKEIAFASIVDSILSKLDHKQTKKWNVKLCQDKFDSL